MVRDHHHLRADLPAAAGRLRDRPAVLRHPRGAEPADLVPDATDGDVGLLPQGDRPARTAPDADLRRRHALPVLRDPVDDPDVCLPADRLLPAGGVLWALRHG